MKFIATRKAEQNVAAVDPWTVVHLSAGLASGLMEIPLKGALSAAVGYEVAEQWFERHPRGQEFFATHGPESVPNAIVDTLVFFVGYRLGELWNRRT